MKAVADCTECGKILETNCRGCIEFGISYHRCNGLNKVVDNISWKKFPEDEYELMEVEENA